VNSVVGADEVRHTVKGIDLKISAAWPRRPSSRRRIRVGVELADHDGTWNRERAAQVNTRLPTCHLAANRDLTSRGIHVNPAALLVASSGVIR
jgi:hypothetical protein